MQLLIITAAFPFLPGEQFLETEIKYWSDVHGVDVHVLPLRPRGERREVPAGIHIDLSLAATADPATRVWSAIKATCSRMLWRELFWLLARKRLSGPTFRTAFSETRSTLSAHAALKRYVRRLRPPVVAYIYWFNFCAYAAALLRMEGLVTRIFVRAHGYDLYEERRPQGYMPLKRQFAGGIDRVAAVSSAGASYLVHRYGFSLSRIVVRRLGVEVHDVTEPSPEGVLRLLTVSFCVPVKRIDKIVDALAILAADPEFRYSIEWIHVGDGPLRRDLEEHARTALRSRSAVAYRFVGSLPNAEVLQLLRQGRIDVLVNSSESEGVPVSIMEAMSFGVPVIAPAVGGISEIVDDRSGRLLGSAATAADIAAALRDVPHYKDQRTRQHARAMIAQSYCADRNYRDFVAEIVHGANEA